MSKVAESSAIEELAVAIGKDVGQLTKLGTTDKSSLVDAINETLARNGGSTAVINVNGGGGINFWVGTQEEYDLVVDKDPETLYMIKNSGVSP